jgi:putative ABC transport system permease protein
MTQFLGEATVLSTLGGVIGILFGLGTVAIANRVILHFTEMWIGVYSVFGVLLSVGATMSIGLFFGAWPAFQAARLDIVECLRR